MLYEYRPRGPVDRSLVGSPGSAGNAVLSAQLTGITRCAMVEAASRGCPPV